MGDNYLTQRIMIARVDERDIIQGEIERWEAHEKGILHRAFTVAVEYDGRIICQHRKHPVFDDVFDLTASSHPRYIDGTLQSNEEAVIDTLVREWDIQRTEIRDLKNAGAVVYRTKDPYSKYIEHEYCYLFLCKIDRLPVFNEEVAYGFSLLPVDFLRKEKSRMYRHLGSWVQAFLENGLL